MTSKNLDLEFLGAQLHCKGYHKCRVCSAHKRRIETSLMCSTCTVALRKTACFGDYHMKKNYQMGTKKFNMIPDMYHNISFKKLP